jgi:cytochrome c556
MRTIITLGTALACALVATAAVAQPAPPTPEEQAAQAIALRQSVYKLLGWNMDPLSGMLRGTVPFDSAKVGAAAANIAGLAPMIPDLFVTDTSGFEVETAALDSIWTNKADFDAKAVELTEAAQAVVAAAGAGDDAATRAAVITMGRVCGSCHDDFRSN